jgi:hypothetical protein
MNIGNTPPVKGGFAASPLQKNNILNPQKAEKKSLKPDLLIKGEVKAKPRKATELQITKENRPEKPKEKEPSVVEQKIEAREQKANPKEALEKLAAKSPAHRTFQRDKTGRIVPK